MSSRIAFMIVLFSLSCTQHASKGEGVNTPLKHIVLLDLKETCTAEEVALVVTRLKTLDRIEGVYNLSVSRRTETDDPRAVQDYDVMLSMEFESLDELKSYAIDEHHLAVRESVATYMNRVPEVIDSME